jgi:DNA-binding response OmpR family regulator
MKLRLEGVDPVSAGDGVEALHMLGNRLFDLVILDIMMPGLNGIETCRRIREDGNGVPVLMLTARAQLGDIERGFEAGATDYMVKPFSPRELAARVLGLLPGAAA